MNKERLLTLATFIEKLEPPQFDFCHLITESVHGCGTVCCAIGWLPKVFPADFVYYGFGRLLDVSGDAQSFFDVSDDTYYHLFCPGKGIGWLAEDATPAQMAAHIRTIVSEHLQ